MSLPRNTPPNSPVAKDETKKEEVVKAESAAETTPPVLTTDLPVTQTPVNSASASPDAKKRKVDNRWFWQRLWSSLPEDPAPVSTATADNASSSISSSSNTLITQSLPPIDVPTTGQENLITPDKVVIAPPTSPKTLNLANLTAISPITSTTPKSKSTPSTPTSIDTAIPGAPSLRRTTP